MIFLVYVSSATQEFSQADLRDLLVKSAANNSQLGLTGLLLYKGGNFMQVLEGDESTVHGLYAKIYRDPRHRGILTLMEEEIQERRFPDWSMGFRDLNSAEALATPGYSEFMNKPLTSEGFGENPTSCEKLLMMFRTNIR